MYITSESITASQRRLIWFDGAGKPEVTVILNDDQYQALVDFIASRSLMFKDLTEKEKKEGFGRVRGRFTPRAEVSEVKPAEFDGDEEDECDTVESRLDAVEKELLALKQTMRENRKEDREMQRQFRNSDQSLRRMQADRIENLEKRQDKGSDYGEFIASVLFNHQRQLNEIQGIDAEPKLFGRFKVVMSEDLEMRRQAAE